MAVNVASTESSSIEKKADQGYTLLRVKRRRDEDPLEALVVESVSGRGSKYRGVDFFQFAQTVEDDEWHDMIRKQAVEDKVLRIAVNNTETEGGSHQVRLDVVKNVKPERPNVSRRYTAKDTCLLPSNNRNLRERYIDSDQPDIKYIDAQLTEENPSDVKEINDLLSAYLKLDPASDPPEKHDDYVWDVFYRRPAPQIPYLASGAVGTLVDFPSELAQDSDFESEEEDEADEDSNAEDNYKNDYPDEEYSDDGSSEGPYDYYQDNDDDDDDQWS